MGVLCFFGKNERSEIEYCVNPSLQCRRANTPESAASLLFLVSSSTLNQARSPILLLSRYPLGCEFLILLSLHFFSVPCFFQQPLPPTVQKHAGQVILHLQIAKSCECVCCCCATDDLLLGNLTGVIDLREKCNYCSER